jgi:hypothetical protein
MYSVLVCKGNAQAVIMQRLVVMGTEVERDLRFISLFVAVDLYLI